MKCAPGEERFPGTTAPPFSPAGSTAMRMGWCLRAGGGELVPQGVSMVHAVRNRKAWGRQWALWVAACEVVGPGVSIHRSALVKRSRLGFQTTMQKKGGRLEI